MEYELTKHEKQSGLDRVRFAENLIKQLPQDHDGRNTWLLNYGFGAEAQSLRSKRNLRMNYKTRSACTTDEQLNMRDAMLSKS